MKNMKTELGYSFSPIKIYNPNYTKKYQDENASKFYNGIYLGDNKSYKDYTEEELKLLPPLPEDYGASLHLTAFVFNFLTGKYQWKYLPLLFE